MIVNYYSIFDKVALEYGPVFTSKNHGVAIRMFNQLVAGEKIDPMDYKLVHVGSFDTESADFISEIYDVPVISKVEDLNVSV